MKIWPVVFARLTFLPVWGLILAGVPLYSADAPMGRGTRLAQVFCTEWATLLQKRTDPALSDLEWDTFVRRLEVGEASPLRGTQRSVVARCIQQNREDLARGAFLLDGLNMLESALIQYQTGRNRVASAPLPRDTVSLPDFGEVDMGVERPKQGIEVEKELRERRDKYAALWQQFLSSLRKTMTERHQALRMGVSVSR